jgi:hypothetical protein
MEALYGAVCSDIARRKKRWLERFQADGFWLLDLADRPSNKLSGLQRKLLLRHAAQPAIARIAAAVPSIGVIVCHNPTYTALEAAGARDGAILLHDEPIPFPLGKWRGAFVERVRAALAGTAYVARSEGGFGWSSFFQ